VNCKDWNNEMPLHYAANYENLELIQLLINKEANLLTKAISGNMPLHCATEKGHLKIIQY
jgi:ankyrin repeat protein